MIQRQILQDLRTMFEGWGISPDDWYVTGEASMVLGGYPVDYRDGIIDVLICRNAWPWPRPEEVGNLMPDEGTVDWSKRVTVGYLDQHSALKAGTTTESSVIF